MSDLISSDSRLSFEATATLRALAGAVIPASPAHGIPGADDEAVFNDILMSARPYHPVLADGLRRLDSLTRDAHGEGAIYAELDLAERVALAEQYREAQPEVTGLLISLICQCYYRDERIMASLGMDPRPPFPHGFEISDGDWSLLDPVRKRGTIYREV